MAIKIIAVGERVLHQLLPDAKSRLAVILLIYELSFSIAKIGT